MTYKLVFKEEALKEWHALDNVIRENFKKKLQERLVNPRHEASRLSGLKHCYKIKLKSAGYRMVYEIREHEFIVSVIAVGKRERNAVYKTASKRL